jgi:aminoglycoside/choline kinase family phosphotransferase
MYVFLGLNGIEIAATEEESPQDVMLAPLCEKFSRLLRQLQRDVEIAQITQLFPEASARRYYRLTLQDGGTLVGVHEDPASARVNMPNVIAVQRFLASGGVAVPQIYASDMASGVMLQQDLGDVSLNQILKDQRDQVELYYQDAILHMLSWQRLRDDGKCPAFKLSFDAEKLMFEFEFFIEHTLLGYYHAQLTDAELSALRAAFAKIAAQLASYPYKVFTHRDYHSRNIMVFAGRQYVIDFQDARMGLFHYDLCSLLCDAYAPLSVARRVRLLDFAFEQGQDIHRQTRGEFDHYWQWSAFQRTVKAMGTFGRQAALGRDDFAAYLPPAWQMLREVSEQDRELRLLAERLQGYTLSSQG